MALQTLTLGLMRVVTGKHDPTVVIGYPFRRWR
jgi:hypothetical protein